MHTPRPVAMPRLVARQHSLIQQIFREHERELLQLLRGLGSPLHVVLPQVFAENICRFKQVLSDAGIQSRILFAKKSNKAACFVQACLHHQIGIDVASLGELTQALSMGVIGRDIGVSGPDKATALLKVALHHQCLIAVDSLGELQRLVQLAEHDQQPCRVLLRCKPLSQPHSRFGFTAAEIDQVLQRYVGSQAHIHLVGFSFHLSGYDIAQRAQMASQLIDLCLRAQHAGFKACTSVNIGGGIAVQYVDTSAWQHFQQHDAPAHYHGLKGFSSFYPYASPHTGADALRALLSTLVEPTFSLSQKLKRHQIQFMIEPGRALLDQAGMSAFRVQGIKPQQHAGESYAHLIVAGSSFSLSEQWFNSEYLPEPIILPQRQPASSAFIACVGGASCLEADMLTWRKLQLPHPVQVGDVCMYLNTAGYQMDSNESTFHEAPIPKKVVVEIKTQGFEWYLDEQSHHHPLDVDAIPLVPPAPPAVAYMSHSYE